jgi:hypothetical protein
MTRELAGIENRNSCWEYVEVPKSLRRVGMALRLLSFLNEDGLEGMVIGEKRGR